MRRFRLLIAPFALLVTALLGIGASVYLRPASAQQPGKVTRPEKVTRPDRPVIYPSFEVDVLVDGRPLRECYDRGRPYVEAIRDAEYEIRLRNPSGNRVAVALSVDGLSTIDARQSSAWNASKWVIEPYQTITISGWQMNSEQARRFYFTTERDSYAAKLGRAGNIGVISAVVFRERRRVVPVTPPPIYREDSETSSSGSTGSASAELRSTAEAAPSASAKSRTRRDEAATGIGRSVRHEVDWIDLDLDSRPVAEVTIRYLFPN